MFATISKIHHVWFGFRFSMFVLFGMLFFPLFLNVAWAAPLPPQPTDLTITHQYGQTFITWRERGELSRERYRIYRHDKPIASSNLERATLLAEVGEGSGYFFTNYEHDAESRLWRPRHSATLPIQDQQPLSEGVGLLVWSLEADDFVGGRQGVAYYAVTTVVGELENTVEFLVENSSKLVRESIDDPRPIELSSDGNGKHVYVQYMDIQAWNPTFHAPNSLNNHYGLAFAPESPPQIPQYAYDYTVYEPNAEACGGKLPTSVPVIFNLHDSQGNYLPFTPPTGKALCAYTILPVDVGQTWYFGFAKTHDYQQAGSVQAQDVVVNYTEQRILRMLDDLMRHPPSIPVDPQRVYLMGREMGASGSLALASRYPNLFAAVYTQEMVIDLTTFLKGHPELSMTALWGASELELPIQSDGQTQWVEPLEPYNGTPVWTWQQLTEAFATLNHHAFPLLLVAYPEDDAQWVSQKALAYEALDRSQQAWMAWDDEQQAPLFANLPFLQTETMPGLSALLSASPSQEAQAFEAYEPAIDWSSSWNNWASVPTDTMEEWQITLRSTNEQTHLVNITPRRLQHFKIEPDATYDWENRSVEDDRLIADGTVIANENGLVTIPQVQVSAEGNRLTLKHSSALPSITRSLLFTLMVVVILALGVVRYLLSMIPLETSESATVRGLPKTVPMSTIQRK